MQSPPQSRSAAFASVSPPVNRGAACLSDGRPPAHTGNGASPASPSQSSEAFAHDARNLLTALSLYADLLHAPGVLAQRYRHYAREIRLLADRSSSLLGRVLSPPTAETVTPPCDMAVLTSSSRRPAQLSEPLCDPATVLQRFLPLLRAQAQGAAEVVLRLGRDIPALPVSAEALERITANLVCNAAEAIRGTSKTAGVCGVVWIFLDVRNGVARLSVEDSGPGMTPAMAARFLGSDMAGERPAQPTGRGWGQQIVHGLARETGGRLSIRPRPTGGTVVTVQWTLPSSAAVQVYGPDHRAPHREVVLGC